MVYVDSKETFKTDRVKKGLHCKTDTFYRFWLTFPLFSEILLNCGFFFRHYLVLFLKFTFRPKLKRLTLYTFCIFGVVLFFVLESWMIIDDERNEERQRREYVIFSILQLYFLLLKNTFCLLINALFFCFFHTARSSSRT